MQPQPNPLKSNDAGKQITLKTKAKTRKRKTNDSVTTTLSERWLDKQDILEVMHISESTLQKWRKKGLLPYSRILGKIYYKESDLQELLNGCKRAKRA